MKCFGKICTKHPEFLGERVKGDCIACSIARKHAWLKANPEKRKITVRKWIVENREQHKKNKRLSAVRCRERDPDLFKRWYADNSEKARNLVRRYAKNNPAKVNSLNRNRHASKLRAIPTWADQNVIHDLYSIASIYRKHGINCHVDHIIPLKSKYVAGLHVPANLQFLIGCDNSRKGNRHWPDMPMAF